ncbi:MAG: hypothetical protein FWH42_00930 [Dehalococcoidia bacterium]|nr:hypothetical protein [Dehalococcoidia bacterium]
MNDNRTSDKDALALNWEPIGNDSTSSKAGLLGPALTLLCLGFGLVSFSIDFFNNGLPVYTTWFGLILLSLGLWILRTENRQLFFAFGLSFVLLLMRTGIYWLEAFPNTTSSSLWLTLNVSMLILFVIQIAFMFSGFQTIAQRMGNEFLHNRLRRSFILFIPFYIASLFGIYLPALVYIAAPYLLCVYIYFVVIINQLIKHSRLAEYEMQPSVSKAKSFAFGMFTLFYVVITVIGNIGCLYHVNTPVPTAIIYENEPSPETVATREQLATLGMPDYVLNDLPDDEIRAFDGVYFACSEVTKSYAITERDGGKLEIFSFYGTVSLGEVRVLYYYRWIESPKHAFVDTFAVRVSLSSNFFTSDNPDLRGLSLYDKDGITYSQKLLNDNELLDTGGFAKIQFRIHASYENQRGYIAATMKVITPYTMIGSNGWATYIHQESVWNHPYFDSINQSSIRFFWSKNGEPLNKVFWMEGFMTTFEYIPYRVTIIDGGIGNSGEGGYYPYPLHGESVVTVYAGTKTGYVFKEWVVETGGILSPDIFDKYSATTSFRMLPSWIILRAVWEPVISED